MLVYIAESLLQSLLFPASALFYVPHQLRLLVQVEVGWATLTPEHKALLDRHVLLSVRLLSVGSHLSLVPHRLTMPDLLAEPGDKIGDH